jgi:DNA invertase Pin-like site-specific DNA recombinase
MWGRCARRGRRAPCSRSSSRIYIDRGFSDTRRTNRAGLDQALAALWLGSILTVTKFDRFARDVADAHAILTDLSKRECSSA